MNIEQIVKQVSLVVLIVGIAALGVMRPNFATLPVERSKSQSELTGKTGAAQDDSNDRARLKGLDVSHFQGEVNWSMVAGEGINFAYAKATEGQSYIDPTYASNAENALKNGLVFGAYHVYRPGTDALGQAQHFLSTVTVRAGMLPPAMDIEIAPPDGVDIANDVVVWTRHVEQKTGCKPILYASSSFWEKYLDKVATAYPLWLAEYSSHLRLPDGAESWQFWQFTDKGSVKGITGSVDLNRFDGSVSALSRITC